MAASASNHHLFLKRPFLPRSTRVRRFSRYDLSIYPWTLYPVSSWTLPIQLLHIIFHTFSPSLPAPIRTSHPCHHHISTGRHPIIPALTFNYYYYFQISLSQKAASSSQTWTNKRWHEQKFTELKKFNVRNNKKMTVKQMSFKLPSKC